MTNCDEGEGGGQKNVTSQNNLMPQITQCRMSESLTIVLERFWIRFNSHRMVKLGVNWGATYVSIKTDSL